MKRKGLDFLKEDPDMMPIWKVTLLVIIAAPVVWFILVFFLSGFFGLLPTGS